MKNIRMLLLAAAAAAALSLTGCVGVAITTQQEAAAAVKAIGQGGGAALLTAHLVDGVVDPVYLAQYEATLPKIAGYMQGAITPADFGKIIASIKAVVTPTQAAGLGLLGSLGGDFPAIAANTATGALVDLECKQLAAGMTNAIGQVTGTNYGTPANAK
jgi:hypothetical protein